MYNPGLLRFQKSLVSSENHSHTSGAIAQMFLLSASIPVSVEASRTHLVTGMLR